jgi:SAM-dependent methyltransferase
VLGGLLLGRLLDRVGAPMMEGAFTALDVRPGERVLDLGFGGGMLVRRLLGAGARVVGVDRSAQMVARARASHRAEIREGRAIFLEGQAHALPLADGAVRRIASVNTLYFWPELGPVMHELSRVLAPSGRLVLAFQTPRQVRAWPGHVHGFVAHEENAVETALGAAGFGVRSRSLHDSAPVGNWCCIVADRAAA